MSYFDGAGVGLLVTPSGMAAEFNRLDSRIKSYAHRVYNYNREINGSVKQPGGETTFEDPIILKNPALYEFTDALQDWVNGWRVFYDDASRDWGANYDQIEKWESDYNAWVAKGGDLGIKEVAPPPTKPAGFPWGTVLIIGGIGGAAWLVIKAIEVYKQPSAIRRITATRK